MTTTSVARPITPLRQRMLDDVALSGLTSDTQSDYIRHVAKVCDLPPAPAGPGVGRRCSPLPDRPARTGRSAADPRQHGVGVALLLHRDVGPADLSERLVLSRYARNLPDVLTVEQIGRRVRRVCWVSADHQLLHHLLGDHEPCLIGLGS
jgi:integrase/recombinase XerD